MAMDQEHLNLPEDEARDQNIVFVDTHAIMKAVEGVQRDRESFQTLLENAENGDSSAYYDLATRYADGEGVEKDEKKAFYWFSMGADESDPRAVDALGRCYQLGFGVEKDEVRAAELYRRAADSGYDPAAEALKRVEERLSRPLWKRLLGFLGR